MALSVMPREGAAQALQIRNTSLPPALKGHRYQQLLGTDPGGDSVTWQVTAGPFTGNAGNGGTPCEGLSLGPTSGVLAGTPVNMGICGPFTVQASDGMTTAREFSVRVNGQYVYVGVPNGLVAVDAETNALVPGFWAGVSDTESARQVLAARDGVAVYRVSAYGVDAFDAQTGASRGSVVMDDGPRFRGAAIAPDGRRLYITDEGLSVVRVVDTATLAECAPQIRTSPGGGSVGPQGIAISPDGRTAYVANNWAGTLAVLDLSGTSTEPSAYISLGGSSYPTTLEVTPDGRQVWVGGWSYATVVDVTAAPQIIWQGSLNGPALDLEFSPDGRYAWVANGSMAVVDTQTFQPLYVWLGGFASYQSVFAPAGGHVYVTADDRVVAVDATLRTVVASVATPAQPWGLAALYDATLRVATTELPPGRVNNAYVSSVVVAGGVGPYRVSGGTLPPGLTLDARGLVTGVPTEAGLFSFTVYAADSSDMPQPAVGSVTIEIGPNRPPVGSLTFTPAIPAPDQAVTFDASWSYDPDSADHIVRYEWNFDGDDIFEMSGVDPVASRSFGAPGAYRVWVRVTDVSGETATSWVDVMVLPNTPPSVAFEASPLQALAGETVTFSVTLCRDLEDGDVSAFTWDFGDGTAVLQGYGPPPLSIEHGYGKPGTYVVRLTAFDSRGWSTSATVEITMTAIPAAGRRLALVHLPYRWQTPGAGGTGTTIDWQVTKGPFTNNAGDSGTACEGFALDAATGILAGTPAQIGTCGPFWIRASDGAASMDRPFSVRVNGQYLYASVSGGLRAIDTEINAPTNYFAPADDWWTSGQQVVIGRDGKSVYRVSSSGVDARDTQTGASDGSLALDATTFGLRDAALAPDGRRLYITNEALNRVHVVDTADRTEILPAIELSPGPGESGPQGIAIAPDGRFAYVSNYYAGLLAVIDLAGTATVSEYIPLGPDSYPTGVAVTPDGRQVWVACSGGITVVDVTALPRTTRRIDLPWTGERLAISPDGRYVWVTHPGWGNELMRIDAFTLEPSSVWIPGQSSRVAFGPTGLYAYVADLYQAQVHLFDASTPAWLMSVTTYGTPGGIASLQNETLRLATASLPPARVRNGYAFSVAAAGGAAPYAFSLASGSLPEGMTLDGAGRVTGLPAAQGAYSFTVSVTDASEPAQTTTGLVTIDVGPGRPPVAEFSYLPAMPVTGQNVIFDAGASFDPDSADRIASYEWDFDGDGIFDALSSTPTVSHVFPAPGIYTVQLRATDTSGMSSPVTSREINVEQNQPPSVAFEADPRMIVAGGTVNFFVFDCWDPEDGAPSRFEWDFGDGTPVVRGDGPPSFTEHRYVSEGDFLARLTVFDSLGLAGESGALISVFANRAPTAAISDAPATAVAGLPVVFDGSGSTDPDFDFGDGIRYAWDFGDGQTASEPRAEHAFQAAGSYTVMLTVTDNAGATSRATVSVNVTENTAPTAAFAFTPARAVTGGRVTFDASASSDPDTAGGDAIVGYAWDFGDGTPPTAGVRVAHSFASPATFQVTLVVTDRSGRTGTVSLGVDVGFGIANSALPGALVGQPYQQALVAQGATSWSIAGGPFAGNAGQPGTPCEGLQMAAPNGFLSGTPVRAGVCGPFDVTVTDGAQAATSTFTIDVTSPTAFVAVNGLSDVDAAVATVDLIARTTSAIGGFASAPAQIVLSGDGRRAFVTLPGQVDYAADMPDIGSGDTVAVIDTSSGAVVDTLDVQGVPVALALSPDGARLYASEPYNGQVAVIDLSARHQVASLPADIPLGVATSLDGRFVYVGEYDGVRSFDANTFVEVGQIRLGNDYDTSPSWLAMHPAGHRLYAMARGTWGTWQIVELDISSGLPDRVLRRMTLPMPRAYGLAISPDGRSLLVPGDLGLEAIDVATFGNRRVPLEVEARGVAASPDSASAYVTTDAGTLVTIDLAALAPAGAPLAVGEDPLGVAVKPNPSFRMLADSLPAGVAGQPYEFALVAAGGVPLYRFAASDLPPWLTLTSSGILVGTPPTAGSTSVTITATDSDVPVQARMRVLPLSVVENTRPEAAFSIDQTTAVLGQPVAFDASASHDPDAAAGDHIVSYAWDFGDGATATGVRVSHVYQSAPPAGAYTVTLTVTDRGGLEGTAERTLEVLPSLPPVAWVEATRTTVFVGGSVSFWAGEQRPEEGSYDPDGWIVNYAWNFGDASPVEAGPEPLVSHAFTSEGHYIVTLTVTDDTGLTDTASIGIDVQVNHPPTARISLTPESPAVGLPVTLGSASTDIDAGDYIANCAWLVSHGEALETSYGCWIEQFAFSDTGTYVLNLTVTDSGGLSSTATRSVEVLANLPPEARYTVTPSSPVALGRAVLDATGSSDPNAVSGDAIATYRWDVDNDGTFEMSGAVLSTSFPAPGSYPVTLKVSDLNGNETGRTETVDVVFGIANDSLPDALVGQLYRWKLSAAGGTAWAVTGGPFTANAGSEGTPCEGLALDAATGVLAGTPVHMGECGPFTVQVTAGEATATRVFTLRVAAPEVYVAANDSSQVTIVDPLAGTTTPVGVSPAPALVVVSPDGRRVYVAQTGDLDLSVIPPYPGSSTQVLAMDAATHGTLGTVTLSGVPTGMALSPDGRWLYVVQLGGELSVVDTASLAVVRRGSSWGALGIAASPDGRWLYLPAENVVHVIDAGTLELADWVRVSWAGSALWPAVHPTGQRLYVATSGYNWGEVVEVDTSAAPMLTRVRETLLNIELPFGLAISPDGGRLFVPGAGGLDTIDTASMTTLMVEGLDPRGAAFSTDGAAAYVTTGSGELVTVDAATLATTGTPLAVGNDPFGVAVRPDRTLRLLTTALPSGLSGQLYVATLVAAGGTPLYQFAATGLPEGITLSPGGRLEGVPSAQGEFNVTITVTDADLPAQSLTKVLALTITQNHPPVASFDPQSPVRVWTAVELDATASMDPDESRGDRIVSYTWDFGDGNPPETGPEPRTYHWYDRIGSFTVTLTVSDLGGATGTAEQQIEVVENLRPVAAFVASPNPVVVSGDVSFSAQEYVDPDDGRTRFGSYDPDGWIVEYLWDFGDGTPPEAPPESWTVHAFQRAGQFVVTLTVTDNEGLSSSTQVLVDVRPSTPPIAVIRMHPPSALVGQPVTLFSESYDPDPGDYVRSCTWDFDDGGEHRQFTECQVESYVFTTPGSHAVTLTVADCSGSTGTVTETLVVQTNLPPVASFTVTPASPIAGGRVVLDATGSTDPNTDAGDVIASYRWDLNGDEVFELSGAVVATSYPSPGRRDVTLKITDLGGNETRLTRSVDVLFGIANEALADALVGQPYQQALVAVGATLWAIADGPFSGYAGNAGTPCEGLTLDGATGRLAGRPVLAGTCGPFTVQAAGATMATRVFTVRVAAPTVYVAANDSSRVTAVDLQAGTTEAVPVVPPPALVAVSPDGRRVYVTQPGDVDGAAPGLSLGGGRRLLIIDAATHAQLGQVELMGVPMGLAVSPDSLRVYVAHGGGEVSVIDAVQQQVVRSESVPWVTGVAVSPDGRWLYAAGQSEVYVLDPVSLTVLNIAALPFDGGVGWLAAHPAGHRLYVVAGAFGQGQFYEMDAPDLGVRREAVLRAEFPYGIAVSPDGTRVAVPGSAGLDILDTASLTRLTAPAVVHPRGVAFSPDGSSLYVTAGDGTLTTIDVATMAPVGVPLAVGDDPLGVAARPNPSLRILNGTLPSGIAGQPYEAAIIAAGGTPRYQFSASGLPDGLTLGADGWLKGVPAHTGLFTVTITVVDASLPTGRAAREFALRVSGLVPPVARPDAYDAVANATLTVGARGVLDNDSDDDDSYLTAVLATPPVHGVVSLEPDGGFAYTPTTDYVGPDPFTYRASDGHSASAPVTVTITVRQATPVLEWAGPADVVYGTALGPAQLNATASVAGTFDYDPAEGTVLSAGVHTLRVTFTPDNPITYTGAEGAVTITVRQATPALTWSDPPAIVYGTALGPSQLNATASVPGAFAYTPAPGTVLPAGTHTLRVTFTPADTANYTTATAAVSLVVLQATPAVTWPTPAAVVYGTALGPAQLNATAPAPGTFVYNPPAGTVLNVGAHALAVAFTPADSRNYGTASAAVSLVVLQATPALTWKAPAAIVYGTALSGTQLNATASVPGTFVYDPPAGTVLAIGTHTLTVTFTPSDSTNYAVASAYVSLTVAQQVFTFTGFKKPVDNPPAANKVKAGEMIPIKWKLTDLNGVPVTDDGSVVSLTSYPVDCQTLAPAAGTVIDELSKGKAGLRHNRAGEWQFDWRTDKDYKRSCRMLELTLSDQTTHRALFSFK